LCGSTASGAGRQRPRRSHVARRSNRHAVAGPIKRRAAYSVAVTEAFLDQIERYDARVKAFLRVDRQAALAQAAAIDRRRKAGQAVGRLGGLPVAVKDLLATRASP